MPVDFEVSHTIDKDVSGSVRRAQRRRLTDAMDKGFAISQEKVPEDRGTLRQTAFQPQWEDGVVKWGYTQPYALPMEEGTQPFQPPVKPLVEWAKRVAGDEGLGYFVALHKIPQEGIDAQPYAKPGAEAAKKWLKANPLGTYLDRELE